MKKIVIVGGGVAGLVTAINLKKENNEIIILEKNSECGKKILLTGNGRCNFYNADMNLSHYHSYDEDIVYNFNMDVVLDFINKLGIEIKVKNGYYYPYTNKASTVRDTLLYEINRRKIKVINNYEVKTINKKNNKFIINDDLECDYVIVSVGGKSYPKTGSSGDILRILSNFNHEIKPLLPSLTNLKTDGDFLKKWHGIREEAKVSLYIDNKLIKEEIGEVQFTDYGVSGICVFNISRYASIGLYNRKDVSIGINFLPHINNVIEHIETKDTSLEVLELLSRMINYKLACIVLDKINLKRNVVYKNLSTVEKKKLEEALTNFKLKAIGTGSFDESQVTIGGVSLKEINLDTFESLKCKNLYIIGEAIDIDGDCGGYNIAFAIYSGLKVKI